MKNQNDLIVRIVTIVLAAIACGVIFYQKPVPATIPAPEKVPAVVTAIPAGAVVTAKGLPGGGESSGGSTAAGGSAPGGGAPNGGRQFSTSAVEGNRR
jgi:hypothetical protein